MSLSSNTDALAARVAVEIKAVRDEIAALPGGGGGDGPGGKLYLHANYK